MKTRSLFGILLLFLGTINLTSCVKDEEDFLNGKTENITVIKGKVQTTDGQPLSGVSVKVDYHETLGFYYSLTRHKAEAKTDINGNYKLEFYVKDGETKKDDDNTGIWKYFELIVNMSNLDSKQYILPGDMVSHILSVDPLVVKPADDVAPTIRNDIFLKRDTTYTQDFYIPKKRYIQITLKGFTTQQKEAYFEVSSYFPWGGEYGTGHSASDMYVASSAERTFEVPFAMNENNIVRLIRLKNGISTTEEHQIYVTKDSPESLTYEY